MTFVELSIMDKIYLFFINILCFLSYKIMNSNSFAFTFYNFTQSAV